MRLTLRTLLAYLDDRLSSANAREIGKKLKESPFARELADRIRAVMRQRRLTTPGRKVKVIDPNLIAEYLDDQLTPELVSMIEKEILASDFSLAEAAASHEIIGLLGDPVDVEDRLRVRLLKQNPNRSADESTDHEFEQINRRSNSESGQDDWTPLPPPKTGFPRSPAVILAGLLIGWIALLVTDPDRLFMRDRKQVTSSGKNDPGLEVSGPEKNVNGVRNDTGPNAAEDPADPRSVNENDEFSSNVSTLPNSDTIDSNPGAAPANSENDSVTTEPRGDSSASPEIELRDPISELRDSAPVSPDEAIRQLEYTVDDPNGMLLSRPADGGDWKRAAVIEGNGPGWHDVVTKHVSALPAPFTTRITPVNSGWTTNLVAPCLVQFNDGVSPELRVYDGRCVIESETLTDDSGKGVLRLVAGGAAAHCSLDGNDVRLGVLVIPTAAEEPAEELPDPNSISAPGIPDDRVAVVGLTSAPVSSHGPADRLPLNSDVSVTLFVAEGSVRIEMEGVESIQVGKGQVLQWITVTGRVLEFQQGDQGQRNVIPDWVYTAGEPAVPAIESAKSGFASALAESEPTIAAARKLCENQDPLLARFAASVLSATHEVEVLVQVLLQTDEEQVRIEAIHGLQIAAAQTLPGRKAVLRALENRLPMRDLTHFVRLLQGVTPSQARDEETSVWLVTMLRHDRAAIRQMAFMILQELTGQTNGYHPDSDFGRRNDAARRWVRFLEKNDDRLLPPE